MNAKEVHDYAWNWFEYHAGQRLLAFRFFLIVLGVLIFGVSGGLEKGQIPLAITIATIDALVSFAFLMLEIRNEQLVNVGRKALLRIEESEGALNSDSTLQLLHADRTRNVLLSHKLWLRIIFSLHSAVLRRGIEPDYFH